MSEVALANADDIQSHVLEDGDVRVTVLSLGCIVQDWRVGGQSVVLGYENKADYLKNPYCMGPVVGRVVNRIGQAQMPLNGKVIDLPANKPPHHIHGGPNGFGKRNWHMDPDGSKRVRFSLHSPHMDQGYPGAVDAEVLIKLSGHRLIWEMVARPDRETPINLAQHLYFNLDGTPDVRDHHLQLDAARYCPANARKLATGEILPVAGTMYDFATPRSLDQADPERIGYDNNYVLDPGNGSPAAIVTSPGGRQLTLWTDQPGLQVYDSGTLGHHGTPHRGQTHGPFAAICLEAQGFPDAPNKPNFPSILCSPDQPYFQRTEIEIGAVA